FAIIGYGNLGKSLEAEIENGKKHELVAIYSRRNIAHKKFRTFASIGDANDFDAALLALGSYNDIGTRAERFAAFDTVDSFDAHARISDYKKLMQNVKPNKISIVSAGWDPGLLSIARGAFKIGCASAVTIWGEGISQGHSNAIRSIRGVLDAVQFTVPKAGYEQLLNANVTESTELHDRVCYVSCVESDKEDVERAIKSMPDYFEGYDTQVIFVTQKEVRDLKKRTSHRGLVRCNGDGFTAETLVRMNSNAAFTAKIMLTYAEAIPKLKNDGFCGALDVFDIPLRYVADCKLI
ncbi:MAG: diaminopimelate dehydrogenase, partial [Corallococcus sp.]|nr:diaminopimelate dehydrogenase [Corallococcus sp.]